MAALACLLGVSAVAHAGPELRLAGSADLAPTTGAATGRVHFRSDARRGGERARIIATAETLDVSRTDDGALPEFRLMLVPPTGEAADLGALRVNARGTARLRRGDVSARLGARTLRDFEGGTAELRNGSAVVLSATIPRLAIDGAGTSVTVHKVFGKMDYVDKPRASPGAFLVESVIDGTGAHRDRLYVSSRRLDTLPDSLGRFPDYRSYIVDRVGIGA